MPDAVRDRLGRWLVPFHYPGRNRRFMSALTLTQRRRYSLNLMARPATWVGIAGLFVGICAIFPLLLDPHGRHRLSGVAGVLLLAGATLLMHHAEARYVRRLAEADFPSHCRTCGYDRRGSPGPCPECGDARPVGGPGRSP